MMHETIHLKEVLSKESASDDADGSKVYEELERKLQSDYNVTLDFTGISLVTTAFLNTAVGKLFLERDASSVSKHLKFSNVKTNEIELFKLVIKNAIKQKSINELEKKQKNI